MASENKALVQRWFDEVWNRGRVDAIDELLAPDSVVHGLGDGQMRCPAAGFKAWASSACAVASSTKDGTRSISSACCSSLASFSCRGQRRRRSRR
jgi:hypothetical protein